LKQIWRQRPVLSWALYDWANSAFSLTVVTVFVPVLLAEYWNDGADSTVTTFRLGLANGLASLVVAISAPIIGAIADGLGRRKGLLLVFAGLGMVMTGSLYFVAQGQWPIALACFVLASIGFAGSNSLYDGLLVHVASPDEYDNVSAYGYALGYLGGALLFTLNTIMVAMPEKFGLASAAEAAQIAFLMVACWWALFSLPLLIGVREQPSPPAKQPVRSSLRRLRQTIGVVIKQRNLLTFLIAYWLYIDGVYTIIKMAVDYGLSQGLSMQHLVQAILITNFVGFPAALVFGRIGSRIGAQRGLAIALTVYIVVTLAAAFITTAFEFYVLAIGIGLVQGGVQSLSRSLYARLIPSGQSAEYFGFFNMIGKFSAILGPVIAGIVTVQTGDQRWGFVSILILFVSGFWLLLKVDPAKPASA
jgi:UMF1 family MFS transporter